MTSYTSTIPLRFEVYRTIPVELKILSDIRQGNRGMMAKTQESHPNKSTQFGILNRLL